MTEQSTPVEVLQCDADCRLLDALDFQVGAVARVIGTYAADWPEPVRIVGIEKYRSGKLNITIADLDGNGPTDGFDTNELIPLPRNRLAARSEAIEQAAKVVENAWALEDNVNLVRAIRSLNDQLPPEEGK